MTEQDEVETQIWVLEPTWQNFSSMYREAGCSQEASSGMEISHHRMAALYFGISTIECLLNQEMTKYPRILINSVRRSDSSRYGVLIQAGTVPQVGGE